MENIKIKKTADILKDAVNAKVSMSSLSPQDLDLALNNMAKSLIENKENILKANKKDEELAISSGNISTVMIDRLRLTSERIDGMAKGIVDVAKLPSPLNIDLEKIERPNGLLITKRTVPFGVIGIIYESRPNVTSDASALSIKSGNVCVLRSGKEAFMSAYAIVKALKEGLKKSNITENAINLIEDTSRNSAKELMTADGFIDLLIPRGGKGLIRACIENATVPCIQTGTGICHIYVDKDADLDMALNIIENAKTSRPSVCNACEVCVVHKDIAKEFLPKLYERLSICQKEKGRNPVSLRCDDTAYDILGKNKCILASKNDFDTEFLDYVLAIKIVNNIDEAINHISNHSTKHSEAIITNNKTSANIFTTRIDSAAVYVNASTRFTDGGEFGFGCEMGISTQKNHPRGPMGLSELTTYKYIISGNGQIR